MNDIGSVRFDALASVVVDVCANVTEGQTVLVTAHLDDVQLVRAVVRAAYRRGAHQVQIDWEDSMVQRIRLQEAPDGALGWVPPWLHTIPTQLGELRGSAIRLVGDPAPGLFDDLDAGRMGRDHATIPEWHAVVMEQAINWAIAPSPTPGWAGLIYPDLPADAALDRLWSDIGHVCRLDEPDPTAAWRARSQQLAEAAQRLTGAQLDSLHFTGNGTDLHVGLLTGVRWMGGGTSTAWGREHLPNLPTEEVFTSPDPQRTHGIVRSTKPLLIDGRAVNGLRIRFEQGRAVEIDADSGAELIRELCARDDGAARLGEVALVDGSGRIGPLDTVFHSTLLDENAASHIALGQAFPFLADRPQSAAQLNTSAIHTDFMIGGPGVQVSGHTNDGHDIEILSGAGAWG